MATNKSIKYRYALDEEKKVIDITSLIHQERNGSKKYVCLGCGEPVIPRTGSIRTWHFAHRVPGNCNPESYLHKLAKERIKAKFDSGEPFRVGYYSEIECPKTAICTQYVAHSCPEQTFLTLDLKGQYDTCELESRIEDSGKAVIPDILLTGRNEQPTFIEICVSHPCEPEKINLGFRIIEIKISSEEDIDNILKLDIIKENDMVQFYNFDRIDHNPQSYSKAECLYITAKKEIRNRYNSGREFKIGFYQDTSCINSNNCVFYQVMKCQERYFESYDLQKYYDTCEILPVEQAKKSDLRLLNKKNPKRKSVDILIQTPFCLDKYFQEKITGRERVITLNISSTKALKELLNSSEVKEGKTCFDNLNSVEAKFYGFKNIVKQLNKTDYFKKVYLYQSGKVYIEPQIKTCKEIKEKEKPGTILELAIHSDLYLYIDKSLESRQKEIGELSEYEIIYAITDKQKRSLTTFAKNCILCKYKPVTFDGKPHYCTETRRALQNKGNEAMTCKNYIQNDERIQEILAIIQGAPIEIIK